MLLPALAFLEGELFTAPEPEDLHVALLEEGLTAPQRRVLDLLNDGSGEVKVGAIGRFRMTRRHQWAVVRGVRAAPRLWIACQAAKRFLGYGLGFKQGYHLQQRHRHVACWR